MMFLQLSENTVAYTNSIIGIFDLDTSSLSRATRDFLSGAEKAGFVESEPGLLPRSFAVCSVPGGQRVCLSPLNTATLKKRCQETE